MRRWTATRLEFVNTIIVGVTSFSTLGIDPSSISITAIFVAGLICKMNAEVMPAAMFAPSL